MKRITVANVWKAFTILAGVASFVLGYVLGEFDVLVPVPELETSPWLAVNPVIAVAVDPNLPELTQAISHAHADASHRLVSGSLPYHLAMTIAPQTSCYQTTIAVSMRRFAGLLSQFRGAPDRWTFWNEFRVEEAGEPVQGLWRLSGTIRGCVPPDAAQNFVPTGMPLRIVGGHFLEAYLDARGGRAVPLVTMLSAHLGPCLTPEHRMRLGAAVLTARLTADFTGPDTVDVLVHVVCTDAAACGEVLAALAPCGDGLRDYWQKRQVAVQGTWEQAGSELRGHITLNGGAAWIAGIIRYGA